MGALRWIALAALAFEPAGLCQAPRVAIEPRASRAAMAPETFRNANFRLDVKLIQIPVTVTDIKDHPVLGLSKENFRLFEDDIEQQVASFSMSDSAVSAGIVFDTSGSMHNHIGESREAIEQFLKTAGPGDQHFLVRFADHPQLIAPFTPNPADISAVLNLVEPHGWTAMNDAVVLSLREMRRAANPRRVLMVFTDGVDNNSRYSDAELLSVLREADVAVFAIGLFERSKFLERMADETGGRVIWVHKISELPDAMERLSLQIRNQYVVGYFSDHAKNDGRYHKVRVEVLPPAGSPALRASWRRGYAAP
jgi:Ca-activated chloride channel family protein